MFGQLLKILAVILMLIGAGVFSYNYFGQTVGPREVTKVQEVPAVVVKKETTKSTTTAQVSQKKVVAKAPVASPTKTNGSLILKTPVVEKNVVAPGPLRVLVQAPTTSALSILGVIEHTNIERAQNGGLPALAENTVLNRDAQMKVDDMFVKQYFEHVSPIGVGPADLAKAVGYAYVIVGENLALGDFGSDQGVVTAWMNSPGHRANILNVHYQEIGAAVGKGIYEGNETWIAVQSFGMPLSACPAIDYVLKSQIDANNIKIANLRTELDVKKALIDATPVSEYDYNMYVSEYNVMVPEYNALVGNNRILVANYNAGVQAFNSCINAAGAH